jgi:hypothetical protein
MVNKRRRKKREDNVYKGDRRRKSVEREKER